MLNKELCRLLMVCPCAGDDTVASQCKQKTRPKVKQGARLIAHVGSTTPWSHGQAPILQMLPPRTPTLHQICDQGAIVKTSPKADTWPPMMPMIEMLQIASTAPTDVPRCLDERRRGGQLHLRGGSSSKRVPQPPHARMEQVSNKHSLTYPEIILYYIA